MLSMSSSLNAAVSPETIAYATYRSTLCALNRVLSAKDVETCGHSERVAAYALRLGLVLGLKEASLVGIEQGALLHDIGKIGVPDAILLKPGRLTTEEQTVMGSHVELGLTIVKDVPLLSEAAHVIGEHHERYDGAGYPNGLRGHQIHVNARVFAVADALDALLSDRPYRASQPYSIARLEIETNAGTHFDPEVVEAFLSVPGQEWLSLRDAPSMRQFTAALTDTSEARLTLLRLAVCEIN